MSLILGLIFLLTIPLANYAVSNIGECVAVGGPCLVLGVPSGAFVAGLALLVRDAVHERYGLAGTLFIIVLGALLSLSVSPLALAVASATAFLFSEVSDSLVYASIRRHSRAAAVLISGLFGSVIDSAIFLWLAFGSLDFLLQQSAAKVSLSILATFILIVCHAFLPRSSPTP